MLGNIIYFSSIPAESSMHISQGTVVPCIIIGIAMVFVCILPIHLEIHFLLSVSSQFDF